MTKTYHWYPAIGAVFVTCLIVSKKCTVMPARGR